MLVDETKMLPHHGRIMRNKAVPILPQAVSEDPELCLEAWLQVIAAGYGMSKGIVQIDTLLGNISYLARTE
jgi:hypothetical protein